MAVRFLLDTNICIYIRRRRPPAVLARFRQLQPGEAVLSVTTYGELVYGAEKSQFREQARGQLDELAALLPVMELPMQAGGFYGSIRAALAAESVMIGNNDLWIAAHGRTAGLILVTNNELAILEAAERKGDLHVGGAESSSTLAEAATIEGL